MKQTTRTILFWTIILVILVTLFHFFGHHWMGILLFSYIVAGSAFVTLGINRILKRPREHLGRKGYLHSFYSVAEANSDPVQRVRAKAWQVLILVNGFTGWPVVFSKNDASFSIVPQERWFSTIGLAQVLAAYSVAYLAPSQRGYARAFLVVAVVLTLTRHLRYFIFRSLPAQLRQVSGNPYFGFMVISFFDLCTLALALSGLAKWNRGGIVSLQYVSTTLKDFLDFKIVWAGQETGFIKVLVSGAALLYYRTLIEPVWLFSEFERTDQDQVAIASDYVRLRRFDKALEHLRKVRAPGQNALITRAIAYLGSNQIEKAFDFTAKALKSGGTEPSVEKIFTWLMGYAVTTPLDGMSYLALLAKGAAIPVADSFLLKAVYLVMGFTEVSGDALLGLFKDQLIRDRFPLTYAAVLIGAHREDEALSRLDSIRPCSAVEQIAHAFLNLDSRMRRFDDLDQAQVYFDQWCASNLSGIDRLSEGLADDTNGYLSSLMTL